MIASTTVLLSKIPALRLFTSPNPFAVITPVVPSTETLPFAEDETTAPGLSSVAIHFAIVCTAEDT